MSDSFWTEGPKRRYRFDLKLHADSPSEIRRVLRQLEIDIIVDYGERLDSDLPHITTSTSGGPDSGYVLRIDQDPTMTSERYKEELNIYLEEKAKRHGDIPDMDTD